ncbi:hypothetical protein SAMN05421780_101363 [Flexibacter flexilis DSM 6793]|uniref:Transposase IS200-like domain-containing protein n=1 Tax=Flexibacter flexilis DSM 6793 TaxID=927664 RepID=A0A1I1DNY5_9BACT|nr:transposase [Flexibacter flexilis]SFB76564.1 hypothetical protein SAMN05421780_101363 [Flexibacter flexilis DSM 6793]
MDKFNNKYRIASARAYFWDYGWNAAYFVTICTQDRINWFGKVLDGKMVLSDIGEIAHKCWAEIPQHFPFVKLGAFVVMPNHVHGIVIIDKTETDLNVEAQNIAVVREQTQKFAPPSPTETQTQNKFGPQSQNLASIIRGFKIGVTKNARLLHANFAWQPRYHDHIIRDERAYHNISEYIIQNPVKWSEDKFYMS